MSKKRKKIDSPEFAAAFWAKVEIRAADACWHWIGGAKARDGRGQMWADGAMVSAPRLAIRLWSGRPIPPGMFACHSCDNTSCCNPAHLWIGTPKENNWDSYIKGINVGPISPRCRKGHEFTPENTIPVKNGKRLCRACHRESGRRYDAKRGWRRPTGAKVATEDAGALA